MSREDKGQTCADECMDTSGEDTGPPESEFGMLFFFYFCCRGFFMLHAGRVNSQTQTQCVHVKNGALARMTEAGGESGPDAWSVSVFVADSRPFCALSWLSLICFSCFAPGPFISSGQMRFCVFWGVLSSGVPGALTILISANTLQQSHAFNCVCVFSHALIWGWARLKPMVAEWLRRSESNWWVHHQDLKERT